MGGYLIEITGWLGAILMLSAYVLLTTGKMSGRSSLYHGLNILAGAGVTANSAWNGAYPSVFINVVWMAIGLYGLLSRSARAEAASPER